MLNIIVKYVPSAYERKHTVFFKTVLMVATVVLEVDNFSISLEDVRLVQNEGKEMFLGMPSYRTKNKQNIKERYYPLNQEFSDVLMSGLKAAYEQYNKTHQRNYMVYDYNINTSIRPILKYVPTEQDRENNNYLKNALGIFSVDIGKELRLNDIVLIKSDKYYLGFPTYRTINKQYVDRFHPNNQETRALFQNAIITEYERIQNQ